MSGLASLNLKGKPKSLAMYQALYQQIRDQILGGYLSPGARLPSSRNLAAEMACSRGSVERAYELLAAEGFITAKGAAGTRVNPELDQQLIESGVVGAPMDKFSKSKRHITEPSIRPLQLGLPALDAFPRKLWNRLINRNARSISADQLGSNGSFGYPPLRQAIANYLAISRGVICEPQQIFITSGFQGALTVIAQTLGQSGEQVWCEDPGYFRARNCFQQLGFSIKPVPVDHEGMCISEGIKKAPTAKFALVTPTHQSPLGVTLSLKRRMELLQWAESNDSWVIEDDYDSEFRYGEKPLPALKSLDAHNRVIYTGSFSKVLIPSLKLGYIVVPKVLQACFEQGFSSLWAVGSLLDQKVVTEFMVDGHFSLHIKKMRKLYGERRAALANSLEKKLSRELSVSLQAGGMHLIGELLNTTDEKLLLQKAQARGLAPHLLSNFQIEANKPPALLLSFTNVEVASAESVVEKLAQAIHASQ